MPGLGFYDSRGDVVASLSTGDDVVYLWGGKPVAILDDESFFAFDGRHIGWLMDGWLRDHAGDAVHFTSYATGAPVRPPVQPHPPKGGRQPEPARQLRERGPLRPARSPNWSNLSVGTAFFDQWSA